MLKNITQAVGNKSSFENENKIPETTFTNFSNAKLLRKNSHINPTQEYPKGYNLRFKISSTQDWLSSINDTNLPKGKFVEHYFLFDAVRVDQFGQPMSETIKIKLPQFELARSLFFYTPYLARSAIIENSLSIDFDIVSNRDHYLINIFSLFIHQFRISMIQVSDASYLGFFLILIFDNLLKVSVSFVPNMAMTLTNTVYGVFVLIRLN